MTVASLGLAVDSGPVAKAVGELDRLTAASTKAEAAAKQITTGTTAAAASTRQLGAATAAAATQMTIATNAVQANNAALAITNQAGGAARAQMQNLSFQIQDIGTMLISGQNPFLLLAQQLPQVTQNGGKLTGVMGALGASIGAIFSPLGLLTTGFVLASSAAITYFSDASDEAEKAAEEMEKHRESIRRAADEWGDAVPQIKAYADELDRAAKLRILETGADDTIAAQYRKAGDALADYLSLVQGADFSAFDQSAMAMIDDTGRLQDAVADLEKAFKDQTDTTDAMSRVQSALASIISSTAIPATGALREAVDALAEAYANAARNAAMTGAAAASVTGLPGRQGRVGTGLSDFEFDQRFGQPYAENWKELFPDLYKTERKRKPRKTEAERSAERYDDMLRQSEQFIASQRLEAEALGMTEEAAQALRYEQDLLNQAANDNVKITPAVAAELHSYAQAMAAAEAETKRLKDQMDFAKDLTRGFFEDMMSGLEQGKSVWESFGNAAMGVLDKLIDKLLNDVLDAIFQVNNAGGNSGGIIGGLIGALGLGGGGFSAAAYAGIGQGLYAKGGVFDQSGVTAFAKGGIVNGPTIFPFAKGIGLMGEAGPEAIMPLTRDGQGRLGVRAGGSGNGGPVNVKFEVINQSSAKVEQQQSKGPDGETIIRAIVRDEQSKSLPKTLQSGFGITPKVTRRS